MLPDRSPTKTMALGATAIGGALAFVVVVFVLHLVQRDYDGVHQLMSELVFGAQGNWMLLAFLGLSTSTLAAGLGLRLRGIQTAVWVLLVAASLAFFIAGVFRLGPASSIHITAIAVAFVATVLAMFDLPRHVVGAGAVGRAISWGLASSTACAVALGQGFLPAGVAQRVAAACVVVWLCVVGAHLMRGRREI